VLCSLDMMLRVLHLSCISHIPSPRIRYIWSSAAHTSPTIQCHSVSTRRRVGVLFHHLPIRLTTISLHLFADNVWWSTGEHTDHSWRHHPHPDAPRCIPCHYDDSAHVVAADATIPSFKAIKGCPCTPELLCAHNNHSDHMSEDWFNKYCDMPRLPHHMYSMHGGAGALMSIGLMRKVSWDFVEPCVLKTYSTGTCTTAFAPSIVCVIHGGTLF